MSNDGKWIESDIEYGKHVAPLPIIYRGAGLTFVATARSYEPESEYLRPVDYAATGETPEAAYAALLKLFKDIHDWNARK